MTSSAMQRVEYENTFLDLIVFTSVHQFVSPVLQALYCGMALLIFAVEQMGDDSLSGAIVATMFYVLMWAAQFVVNVLYLYSRKNRSVLTRHVIELRDEGLYEATQFNQSMFFWPGIVKAVRLVGYVAVYVTPHIAHIIPKRAFSSPSDVEEFIQTIRRKMRAV